MHIHKKHTTQQFVVVVYDIKRGGWRKETITITKESQRMSGITEESLCNPQC